MTRRRRPARGVVVIANRTRGLIAKVGARFDVPVTHLASSVGLVEEGVPA
jgi:DNA-binding transcriptional regulator YdaS (Cro superfamily)